MSHIECGPTAASGKLSFESVGHSSIPLAVTPLSVQCQCTVVPFGSRTSEVHTLTVPVPTVPFWSKTVKDEMKEIMMERLKPPYYWRAHVFYDLALVYPPLDDFFQVKSWFSTREKWFWKLINELDINLLCDVYLEKIAANFILGIFLTFNL